MKSIEVYKGTILFFNAAHSLFKTSSTCGMFNIPIVTRFRFQSFLNQPYLLWAQIVLCISIEYIFLGQIIHLKFKQTNINMPINKLCRLSLFH